MAGFYSNGVPRPAPGRRDIHHGLLVALDVARAQGELPDGVNTDELARVLAALAMDALSAWAQGDGARLRSRIQTRADVVLAGAQTVNQERALFAVTDRVPARSRPCRPCIHSDPAMAATERPVGADGWTMEYRNLGRTDLKVSPLCLGTMNFGPRTSEADSFSVMDKALDAGISFFDTANRCGGTVTAPIIGPRTADQFTGSLRAVEIQLESAVLRELDRIFSGTGRARARVLRLVGPLSAGVDRHLEQIGGVVAQVKLTLPDDILAWIEDAAGQPVTGADRIPGGATREGWFVDVKARDGGERHLFLRYSPTPMPERSAFHPLATEAAVMHGLAGTGVAVPPILGVHPHREAVLEERMPGAHLVLPDQGSRRAGAGGAGLRPQSGHPPPPRSATSWASRRSDRCAPAREHALERIAAIRQRGTGPDGSMDPLLRLSTDWLERNVPDYDGPVVLVQGDTGPGTPSTDDGRVTAVVDWELSHWGDPMDDVAWLSLRTVQDTFTYLPDRLAEYSELSGHAIDESRVWYYRLFAESTMTTLYPNNGTDLKRPGEGEEETVARDIGNGIIYRQLHRRLWLESLAAVMGLELDAPSLPEPADLPEWHHLYGTVLGSLQTIVPRISDPLANQWTKGVARVVKYLQDLDASGREFNALEGDEIAALLGHGSVSLAQGRKELAEAARTGQVTDEDYVRYLWHKVQRDDHLMRHASGALHERTWPPVVSAG